MDKDRESRTDTAVPHPDGAEQLSSDEKRALELSEEIQHTQGTEKEHAAESAEDLAGGTKS